ncbi:MULTISPECIES: helix-turn-helix transcriptional regulator [Salinibaculum]|uniref:helix-turn-helix transcriptional regulator n=1 Tax=Salinibaculum TaxID=2732368 RepID=UPI0030D41CB5
MTTNDMDPALEAIQFFANSANSVRVFEALANGVTTSSTLAERTGASRSTVARILDEGESRGWVESEGRRYELTYMGEVMIEEFQTHLETVEGAQQLRDVINQLPEPARELDIRHLRDAEITTPSEEWPQAHFKRALELYRTGETYRGLTQIAPEIIVRTLADGVERGQLELEGVIEAAFIEELLDSPERAAPWHTFADQVWVYDGQIPVNMHLIDGRVVLWFDRSGGNRVRGEGLLESEHPAVVSWAESLYEKYKSEAEPFDSTMLPEA